MDDLQIQIGGALALFLTTAAAYLKSRSEVSSVKREREVTKQQRDTEIALLKAKSDELERRQNAADSRTTSIENKLDETNCLLSQLVGMFKMALRASPTHAPEKKPL